MVSKFCMGWKNGLLKKSNFREGLIREEGLIKLLRYTQVDVTNTTCVSIWPPCSLPNNLSFFFSFFFSSVAKRHPKMRHLNLDHTLRKGRLFTTYILHSEIFY